MPGLVGGGLIALLGVVPALRLTWGESPEIVAKANQIYVFDRLPHHLALLALPTEELVQRLRRHAVLLAAMWLLVGAKTLAGAWRGNLFVSPCIATPN